MFAQRKISLKAALIVPFVCLLIFTVSLVGALSFYNGRKAVRDLANQLRSDITLRIHEHLNTFLTAPHVINQINSDAMREGQLDATNQKMLEHHFWQQIKIFESVTSIYFGNPAGGHVNSGREGAEGAQYIIATDGFVSGSFDKYATDENGNRTDLIVTVPDFDSRKRQWYVGAVEKGDAYWTPVYILFTGQDMAIAASRPVYDGEDQLIGVVSVDIFLSHISHFLKSIKIGKTGEAFIVERSGLLVASSSEENPFVTADNKKQQRINVMDSTEPLVRNASIAVKNSFGGFQNIQDDKYLEYSVDGKKRFLQVSPIQDKHGLDWLAVVVVPESDFLAVIRANNKSTMFLMLLALVCAVFLGGVTAKIINSPIEQLNISAMAMADGKWTKSVLNESSLGEVNQLVQSFNKMAVELEKEKEFSRAVMNTIPDTVYVFDPESGEPLVWNRAMEEVSGFSADEILTRKAVHDWFCDENKDRVDDVLKTISASGKAVVEFDLITKDGSRIPTEYNASEFTSGSDLRRMVVSVGRDISERKKAEEELKENAERFNQMFFCHSAVMLLIVPESGIIVEANDAAHTYYGYSKDEFCGMHVSRINQLPEENLKEEMRQAASGDKNRFEFPHRLASGEVRQVSVLTSPIVVNGQKLLFSIVTDITERKKAEGLLNARMLLMEHATKHTLDELLTETLDQIEELTGSSIGFYHFVDSDHMNLTLQAWSTRTAKEFCKIEGKGMNYAVGDAGVWCDCVREKKAVVHNDYASIRGKKGMPEGHAEVVRELVVPIFRNDQVVAILGVGNKVSDYDEKDVEIVTHMADVAWEIVTHKLMEEEKERLGTQLLQSQKMEAIGNLAGGVAHDFNNLLGIIMGSAQLAMYDLDENSDPYKEMTVVVDTGYRAKDLIMQLLTFARKERSNKSVYKIESIISNVVSILERSVLKNIHIKKIVDENIRIQCDENQLYQAILNICNNAADALGAGGEISIECKAVEFYKKNCSTCGIEMNGKYCFLQISDTGEGISPEILPKVFEPFFTTKDVGKGTGLGLSVTHGIIKSHNGHMHIESELSRGTQVKIYLPLTELEPEVAIKKPVVKKADKGSETILVIDDEKGMLEMAGRLLRRNGYEPLLAAGPLEGIELFTVYKEKIAVVILDLLMPEMDGAEVFRIIRDMDPSVKVVFSSGYGINDQAASLMMEDGEYRYIQKPYDIDEMYTTIRNLIDEMFE